MKEKRAIEVVFFDAVGTLIHLPQGVGYHYRLIGERHGLQLGREPIGRAFRAVWKVMPVRMTTKIRRRDDDKEWWRELVARVLAHCDKKVSDKKFDDYFEDLYHHFTVPGVWKLFPEVVEVLHLLAKKHRLAVISNFDGRLRVILDQFDLGAQFEKIIISSEVGADKPDPFIFQHALDSMGVNPARALHVGDDPVNDWQAAEAAGMKIYRLERPENSLLGLAGALRSIQTG